jgi:hypothetical protein
MGRPIAWKRRRGDERRPSRKDDIDLHQHLLLGGIDVDVAGLVVVAAIGELERLVADVQRVFVLEGDGRQRNRGAADEDAIEPAG